jgi:hypothetical protein
VGISIWVYAEAFHRYRDSDVEARRMAVMDPFVLEERSSFDICRCDGLAASHPALPAICAITHAEGRVTSSSRLLPTRRDRPPADPPRTP